MEKLVSSWNNVQTVPEKYVFPPEKRPGNVTFNASKSIPVIDLEGIAIYKVNTLETCNAYTKTRQWCGRCYGCLEEERIGLLEIKALIDPNSVQGELSDWMDKKEGIGDCCQAIHRKHSMSKFPTFSITNTTQESLISPTTTSMACSPRDCSNYF
ncbi:hypothetical protein OIU79_018662 [Salix purpurea]|uniref:Uncharacterized protein n=1 Tax=Salix purpurea TaxID=77065 RepID=A0A9Q0WYI0_SALPP|nr:hypothetical protein OIU79_018662 [Salix purpurea]